MIKVELQNGQIIYLTESLEKDYLVSIRHEKIHEKINAFFGLKSEVLYCMFEEDGECRGTGGSAFPIYQEHYDNPLVYFKYILLELIQLFYEFLFALTIDPKQFKNLLGWVSTLFGNLFTVFPRRSFFRKEMVIKDEILMGYKNICPICKSLLLDSNSDYRRLDNFCTDDCKKIMAYILKKHAKLRKKYLTLVRQFESSKETPFYNFRVKLFLIRMRLTSRFYVVKSDRNP